MQIAKTDRNTEIVILLVIGLSMSLIGEVYRITKSRVHAIKKNNIKLYNWLMSNRLEKLPEIMGIYKKLIMNEYEQTENNRPTSRV